MSRQHTSKVQGLRRWILLAIVFAFAGLAVQHSNAALFTLTDDNSHASFDTTSPSNNFNWTVDNVNQLTQQAFWYRVGNTPEQSLHLLPIGVQGTTDPNFDGNPENLFVRYLGAGFKVEVNYRLDGGTPGSGSSDMSEQISIVNTSTVPLDFHFFQYSDFDLNGTPGGDSIVFTNPNTVRQSEPGSELTETVVTPVPSHREAAAFNATLVKLNDGVVSNLSDSPAVGTVLGPGDMTWAYQWDFVLNPGDTFQISKDKNLDANPSNFLPEPGTASLLAIGGALLLLTRFRKRFAGGR